jgi:hypothetical protein
LFGAAGLLLLENLPAVSAPSGFCFCHTLRYIIDLVVNLEVAEEGNPVVDKVTHYKVSSAIAAFDDVFVRTCLHQQQYIVRPGIRT